EVEKHGLDAVRGDLENGSAAFNPEAVGTQAGATVSGSTVEIAVRSLNQFGIRNLPVGIAAGRSSVIRELVKHIDSRRANPTRIFGRYLRCDPSRKYDRDPQRRKNSWR